MSFTPTHFKAIAYACEVYDAVPELTVYPTVRLRTRENGSIIENHVTNLVGRYKQHLKEMAAADKRRRREQARR
jgi:hypothetical protein